MSNCATARCDASSKSVVDVVLPASGIGARTGSVTPKQFWTLQGRPLLFYTLSTFAKVPGIRRIVVPIAKDFLEESETWLEEWQLSHLIGCVLFVKGGSSRHTSIKHGLKYIDMTAPPTVIVVHDAVRPFVDVKTIVEVAQAAVKHKAGDEQICQTNMEDIFCNIIRDH
eukprot:gene9222-1508_t